MRRFVEFTDSSLGLGRWNPRCHVGAAIAVPISFVESRTVRAPAMKTCVIVTVDRVCSVEEFDLTAGTNHANASVGHFFHDHTATVSDLYPIDLWVFNLHVLGFVGTISTAACTGKLNYAVLNFCSPR